MVGVLERALDGPADRLILQRDDAVDGRRAGADRGRAPGERAPQRLVGELSDEQLDLGLAGDVAAAPRRVRRVTLPSMTMTGTCWPAARCRMALSVGRATATFAIDRARVAVATRRTSATSVPRTAVEFRIVPICTTSWTPWSVVV